MLWVTQPGSGGAGIRTLVFPHLSLHPRRGRSCMPLETCRDGQSEGPSSWRLGQGHSHCRGGCARDCDLELLCQEWREAELHSGKTQSLLVDFGVKDQTSVFCLFAFHCFPVGRGLCPEGLFLIQGTLADGSQVNS